MTRTELAKQRATISTKAARLTMGAIVADQLLLIALMFLRSERDGYLFWLPGAPGLDPLRPDPRFAYLVRRMGLPPPSLARTTG